MKVDHCYSDIGCFPLGEEFYHPEHRPFNVRPWHRKLIKTEFELYNAQHPEGYTLRPWNRLNLIESHFNPLLETKVIIPGWLDNIKRAVWVLKLKDALLYLWHPVNIIVVDWRNFTPYTIATANTRVVGAELANLMKFIEAELNYDRSYYHIIGHSLGAHVGGYCGDRVPGLGRITALDPARPFFQGMPKVVRLDRGDAKFVDAIHSDFTPENAIFLLMSYGMTTPVGHLDFYPNGPPLMQPGCLRDTLLSVRNGIQQGLEHSSLSIAFLESLRYLTACDHQRSHEWFIESIVNRQCLFVGVRCNEFDGLINGQCTCDDSRSACAIMGIHADQMYINEAHEDLWPLRSKRPYNSNKKSNSNDNNNYPKIRPPSSPLPTLPAALINNHIQDLETYFVGEQLIKPQISTKEEMYAEMKHQASLIRQPSPPQSVILDELASDLETLQDEPLLDYLRANLLITHQHQQHPASKRNDNLTKRQDYNSPNSFVKQEIEYMLETQADHQHPMNEHPKLMSDLDRDIEQWYEGTSKWFLKTNNRPNYCANQYQILVYLGPLKSSRRNRKFRANLIISIIGSRGQLMNQRFIPRSASLDSFTMQPFFILLEGSYSLGNIISVAVGWEARIDPDPIQATISFNSSPLLNNIQSAIPAYHAKHPLFSETMKYDYSDAFRYDHKSRPYVDRKSDESEAKSKLIDSREEVNLDNRHHYSLDMDNNSKQQQPTTISSHRIVKRSSLNDDDDDDDLPMEIDAPPSGSEICSGDDTKGGQQGGCQTLNPQVDPLLTLSSDPINTLISPDGGLLDLSEEMEEREQEQESEQDMKLAVSREQLNMPTLMAKSNHLDFIEEFLDGEPKFKAELHNINLNPGSDSHVEDSIVVTEVRVSPLQAHFGKNGPIKIGKTFCPPHLNYKLRRDQTVKLRPSLIGKCRLQNRPHPLSRPMEALIK